VARELIAAQRLTMRVVRADRPAGYGSAHPDIMVSFADLVGQAESGTAPAAARLPGYTSLEVSRAEFALTWQSAHLRDRPGVARVVRVWLLCRAIRKPFRRECKRRGWSSATAYRRRDLGLSMIVSALNKAGAPPPR
jgi:hypothetical protein